MLRTSSVRMRRGVVALAATATLAITPLVTSSTAQAAAENSGGAFVAVTPTRLVNTTGGSGAGGTGFAAGQTRSYDVLSDATANAAGIPSSGVSAVVVDVAVKNATATSNSYLTVWNRDEARPSSATMYYTGETAPRSNTTVVKMGSSGGLSVYNFAGSADIDIDILGYFTAVSGTGTPGGFVAINPERRADTVNGVGVAQAPVQVGSWADIQVTNGSTIPDTATSVFANLIVASDAAQGNLRVGKGGQSPAALPATVNYQDNGSVASGTMLPLSTDGKIRVLNYNGGAVHFKIDVLGFVSGDSSQGGTYTSLNPALLYTTFGGANASLAAGETRIVDTAGVAGIPDSDLVGSVAVSLTARNWINNGTLTVFSTSAEDEPTGRNLQFMAGEGAGNSSTTAIANVGPGGKLAVRNTSSGTVDFQLTAQGWFSASDYETGTEESDDGAEGDASSEPVENLLPAGVVPDGTWSITTKDENGNTVYFDPNGDAERFSSQMAAGGSWWDGQCNPNTTQKRKFDVVKQYNRPRPHSRMKGGVAKMYCGKDNQSTFKESDFGLRHIRAGHKQHFQKLADLEGRDWGNFMHWSMSWVLKEPQPRTVQNATRFCYQKTFGFRNPNGSAFNREVVVILGKTGVRIMTAFPTPNASYCQGPSF